jgi:hypothetical protein
MTKDPFDAYLRFFQTLTPESLAQLDSLVAPDIRFRDPFNDVTGPSAMRKVFDDMFARFDDPRFVVTDRADSADRCYARWRFTASRGGRDWTIEGVSEIVADGAGHVVSHVDHWDAASQVYERIPVFGALVRAIRKRASASR